MANVTVICLLVNILGLHRIWDTTTVLSNNLTRYLYNIFILIKPSGEFLLEILDFRQEFIGGKELLPSVTRYLTYRAHFDVSAPTHRSQLHSWRKLIGVLKAVYFRVEFLNSFP